MIAGGGIEAFERAPGARPRVIGHRGVRGDGPPENTLAAFEAAARGGADAIELDVRACATGELVCVHDPTLDRVTGGRDRRPVAAITLRALRAVDLGGGERVPTLTEVLELCARLGLALNVEMKRDVPDRSAIVRATAEAVSRADVPLLVSSFDPAMLLALRLIAPRIARAQLIHDNRWAHAAAIATSVFATRSHRGLGARAVHIERKPVLTSLVPKLKAAGLVVNVWTVNDPAEARHLAALGADGIITDDAASIVQSLQST